MVDFADNTWAFRGEDGLNRSHVPAQPLWVGFLRIAQLAIAFIILVLTAYAAGQFGSGNLAGFGLAWFTFIWTVGYFVYLGVSTIFIPQIYNYFVHLGLEVLSAIWWLCTWAVLASEASALSAFHFDHRFFRAKSLNSAIDCVKASAGLGALVWLLFLASLAFLVLSVLNHRKTEAGNAPVTAPMTSVPPGGPVGQAPPQQPVYPQQAYQQPTTEGYPQGQYPPQQQQVPPQGSPYHPQVPYPPPQQQQQQQQAPYPQ